MSKSKIKTREKGKDIKVLDKSAVVGQRMKSAFIRSKKNAEALMDDRQATPNEYAADKTELAADDLAHDAANVAASDRAGSCFSASGRSGRQKSAKRIRPPLNSPTPLDRPRV